MSQTELVGTLHHPRPTVARAATSNACGATVTRPSIQYSGTPVPRPAAPVPSRPEVRTNAPLYSSKETNGLWTHDNASSPAMTRRSGKPSDGATPTYVGEHVLPYPDGGKGHPQAISQPAILRQRSASGPEHHKANGVYGAQPSVNAAKSIPVAKPRTVRQGSSNVHFTPDNLFVSIVSPHTLTIHNLTPSNNGPNAIMDSVRRDVLALWPAGVRVDNEARGEWTVRLNGKSWTARGQHGIVARRMVTNLFSIMALHGYSYLCSIQSTNPLAPPRHLFTSSQPSATRFFSLAFSLYKRKLTFIDVPSDINVAVSNALKNATMYDVEEVDDMEDTAGEKPRGSEETDGEEDARRIYTYKLTKRTTVSRSKKNVQLFLTRNETADMLMLLSQLLKVIATHGYRLDASVPLGSMGPLRLQGRREMWIFKAVSWKVDSPLS